MHKVLFQRLHRIFPTIHNLSIHRQPLPTFCVSHFMHVCYLCLLSYFNHAQLFVALWTIACQALLSMELSRQEYWSGLAFSPSRSLPNPGIEPRFFMSPALAGRFFTTKDTWEAPFHFTVMTTVTQ